MSLPRRPCTFYFDFLSPYAFIAWTQLDAISERVGAAFEPRPVLFAGLLDAHGQKGPAEIPAKKSFTFDAYRKAHRWGLPELRPPPTHPFNPLLALRVASLPLETLARRRLIDALFAATWTTGTGVETPEAVANAAKHAGLDGEELVRASQEPEAKQRLRLATEEAVARGVFGVPTLVVDDELFWGTDNLELFEAYVRGDDPLPKDLSWAEREPSAKRRGVR